MGTALATCGLLKSGLQREGSMKGTKEDDVIQLKVPGLVLSISIVIYVFPP